MRPFGWDMWNRSYRKFLKSNWHSLERWGLAYLHSPHALDALACAIAQEFSHRRIKVVVSIESVWIDGTPQVKAETHSGKVQCELADLLFILDERDAHSHPLTQRALLLQGKTSPKYNKLDAGASTKKERRLLEDTNRRLPIDVFRDIAATSKIGTYTIGGVGYGFADCARYLLMPKGALWRTYFLGLAPFQIGWPATRKSAFLRSPRGVVQAIQQMAIRGSMGRLLSDPKSCEWSRLVRDLLGGYRGIVMKGYSAQCRVNSSSSIASFLSHGQFAVNFNSNKSLPPLRPMPFDNEDAQDPPAINVLKVSIQYANTDNVPDTDV